MFPPAVLWLVATFSLGGVAAPYERFHLLLLSLVAGLTLFYAWQKEPWNDRPPFPFGRWLLLGAASFLLLSLLQLVPLPRILLKALAPLSSRLTFDTLLNLRIPTASYYPITLDRHSTALAAEQLFAFFLIFAAALAFLAKPERRTRLAHWLSVAAAGIAFFGLVHRFSGATRMFWLFERGWTFFGPYVSANHAGALFASTAALTLGLIVSRQLSKTDRTGLYFVLSVISLGLLFTGSRAAVLSLGVAVIAQVLTTHREKRASNRLNLILFAVVAGTAVAWKASFLPRIAATPEALAAGREFRFAFWGYALDLWKTSPLFGIGLGAFRRISPFEVGDSIFLHPEHAENDYLELLACGGLAGFVLVAIPLFFLVRKIIATLRSDDAANTTKGFALALLAFLTNSLFVFNAPLPAHQILFALLLAGFLASQRFSLLTDKWMRYALSFAVFAGLSQGIVRGVHSAVPQGSGTAETIDEKVLGDSPVNLRAASLAKVSEAEAVLAKDPLDNRALYDLASASAELGENDRAKQAAGIAGQLNPFDLFRRLRVSQVLEKSDPRYTLRLIESVLEGQAPLSPDVRLGLHLEAALAAVRLGEESTARENLENVEAASPGDWRVPLIRMLITRDPVPLVRESWKQAQDGRVETSVWDRWLLQGIRGRKFPTDLQEIANLKWDRPDLGTFLARLSSLEPKRERPLVARLDFDPPVDFLRPNTPESAINARLDGRTIEVRVIRHQLSIDAYMTPLKLVLDPPHLTIRMVVRSPRPLTTQLLIEIDGKLLVTKEPARPFTSDLWELFFRNVGISVPAENPNQSRYLTGVGFTPLEKDGRYVIEAIEIFVDSVR